MRAIGFLLVLGVGVFVGAVLTIALLPEATAQDVFGPQAALFDFSHTLGSMGGAFRGVMTGVLWGAFGLTIAAIISFVFGTIGKLFR